MIRWETYLPSKGCVCGDDVSKKSLLGFYMGKMKQHRLQLRRARLGENA